MKKIKIFLVFILMTSSFATISFRASNEAISAKAPSHVSLRKYEDYYSVKNEAGTLVRNKLYFDLAPSKKILHTSIHKIEEIKYGYESIHITFVMKDWYDEENKYYDIYIPTSYLQHRSGWFGVWMSEPIGSRSFTMGYDRKKIVGEYSIVYTLEDKIKLFFEFDEKDKALYTNNNTYVLKSVKFKSQRQDSNFYKRIFDKAYNVQKIELESDVSSSLIENEGKIRDKLLDLLDKESRYLSEWWRSFFVFTYNEEKSLVVISLNFLNNARNIETWKREISVKISLTEKYWNKNIGERLVISPGKIINPNGENNEMILDSPLEWNGKHIYGTSATIIFNGIDSQTETVKINGTYLQVINNRFQFNMIDDIKKGINEYHIVIEKHDENDFNKIIAKYEFNYTILQRVPELLLKWYAWDPTKNPDQQLLVTKFIDDGKQNPNYDPEVNPQTGTKTQVMWVRSKEKAIFPLDPLNANGDVIKNVNDFEQGIIAEGAVSGMGIQQIFDDPWIKSIQRTRVDDRTLRYVLDPNKREKMKKVFHRTIDNLADGEILPHNELLRLTIESLKEKCSLSEEDLAELNNESLYSSKYKLTNVINKYFDQLLLHMMSILKDDSIFFEDVKSHKNGGYHSFEGTYLYRIVDQKGFTYYKYIKIGQQWQNKYVKLLDILDNHDVAVPFWSTSQGNHLKSYLIKYKDFDARNIESLNYETVMYYWKEYVSSVNNQTVELDKVVDYNSINLGNINIDHIKMNKDSAQKIKDEVLTKVKRTLNQYNLEYQIDYEIVDLDAKINNLVLSDSETFKMQDFVILANSKSSKAFGTQKFKVINSRDYNENDVIDFAKINFGTYRYNFFQFSEDQLKEWITKLVTNKLVSLGLEFIKDYNIEFPSSVQISHFLNTNESNLNIRITSSATSLKTINSNILKLINSLDAPVAPNEPPDKPNVIEDNINIDGSEDESGKDKDKNKNNLDDDLDNNKDKNDNELDNAKYHYFRKNMYWIIPIIVFSTLGLVAVCYISFVKLRRKIR